MKTPREILLAKHLAAEARLDAIRREVVSSMRSAPAELLDSPETVWSLCSVRWLRWASIGAAWLCIGLMQWHAAQPDGPARSGLQVDEQDMTLNLRANRQILLEAIGPTSERVAFVPKPRVCLPSINLNS